MAGAGPLDRQWAAAPAPGIAADGRCLQLAEQWQDIGIAPTGIAGVAPGVVVLRGAAHIDRAIDGAGAANHTACCPAFCAALQAGVGLAGVLPVIAWPAVHPLHRNGHTGAQRGVGAACFQHQHRPVTSRGQASGDDTARGAGANHQVVNEQRFHCFTAGAMPRSINVAESAAGFQPRRCLARSAR